MINLHLYLGYLLFVLILSFTPGPNMVLMLSNGMHYKFRDAIATLPGLLLALLIYLSIAVAALYHVIDHLPDIFFVLKILGGCYLIYLAFKHYHRMFQADAGLHLCSNSNRNLFVTGFICCLANPKVLVTCLAVLPQFIDHDLPILPQLLILATTHMLSLSTAAIAYCYFANRMNGFITHYHKWMAGVIGTVMLILGISVLLARGMAV